MLPAGPVALAICRQRRCGTDTATSGESHRDRWEIRVHPGRRHPRRADWGTLRIDDAGGFVDGTALTLRIRRPEWAVGDITLRLDETPVDALVADGYLVVHRPWVSGETLHIDVPMTLRARSTPDDATLQSIEFGPSVLVARSNATTTLELPLAQRRRVDGSLRADDAMDAAAIADAMHTDGGVSIAGVCFEPVWTGKDERYHMYVRASGATVGFVDADTNVPVRHRQDGRSLLDDVWAEPTPSARADFLDRVGEASAAARREGLLTNDELTEVLSAAAVADIDGTGTHLVGPITTSEAITASEAVTTSGGASMNPAPSPIPVAR